ncbi:divalent cation transporter [Marinomonas sp. S3726]|uniref:ZIP family metal transporter n=1 Tax=Marinomonas sp. S3726 TaxID=579484 RepID=UPI0005FA072E|nr:divalent cation transporter [Marinomonas sp. S3726]KJZ10774.1 divalent cation transporter [Marinomonas sp. S3726]
MPYLVQVILLTLAAGLAMPAGALIARFEHIQSDWLEQELRHSVVAFGAGALLSAVALVLVPEAIQELSMSSSAFFFLLGGVAFMLLDILLQKINTPASQLAAMLTDFVPESIALGAAFAYGSSSALLLALLIALQNLPEGFNAYREMRTSKRLSSKMIILMFALMALLGPLSGVVGYLWLAQSPLTIAALMMFAAGGILYSIFQDIAPQVPLQKHWAPPMGALLGFLMGVLASMALSH